MVRENREFFESIDLTADDLMNATTEAVPLPTTFSAQRPPGSGNRTLKRAVANNFMKIANKHGPKQTESEEKPAAVTEVKNTSANPNAPPAYYDEVPGLVHVYDDSSDEEEDDNGDNPQTPIAKKRQVSLFFSNCLILLLSEYITQFFGFSCIYSPRHQSLRGRSLENKPSAIPLTMIWL